MREKPAIDEDTILEYLNTSYGIFARSAEFLPIGADGNAWAYRVDGDKRSYFLKLRRGMPAKSMLIVPDYLVSCGVTEVVPPITTSDGGLYVAMDDKMLILYPFIDGKSAWGKRLSEQQMRTWGDIMRRIHQTSITDELSSVVPHETYVSTREPLFLRMNRMIMTEAYTGKFAIAVAEEWKARLKEIQFVYNRYRALGARLKLQRLLQVICHADIHQANILIENDEQIRVVDWDEVIIAPKERDLMFFDVDHPDPDSGFFAGYRTTDINYVAIAYYRYEWVVQEFAEWVAWILDDPDRPTSEKEHAISEFRKLFQVGNVVEVAHQAFERM